MINTRKLIVRNILLRIVDRKGHFFQKMRSERLIFLYNRCYNIYIAICVASKLYHPINLKSIEWSWKKYLNYIKSSDTLSVNFTLIGILQFYVTCDYLIIVLWPNMLAIYLPRQNLIELRTIKSNRTWIFEYCGILRIHFNQNWSVIRRCCYDIKENESKYRVLHVFELNYIQLKTLWYHYITVNVILCETNLFIPFFSLQYEFTEIKYMECKQIISYNVYYLLDPSVDIWKDGVVVELSLMDYLWNCLRASDFYSLVPIKLKSYLCFLLHDIINYTCTFFNV